MFYVEERAPFLAVTCEPLHKGSVAIFASVRTADIGIDGISADGQRRFCHDAVDVNVVDDHKIFLFTVRFEVRQRRSRRIDFSAYYALKILRLFLLTLLFYCNIRQTYMQEVEGLLRFCIIGRCWGRSGLRLCRHCAYRPVHYVGKFACYIKLVRFG